MKGNKKALTGSLILALAVALPGISAAAYEEATLKTGEEEICEDADAEASLQDSDGNKDEEAAA